MVNKQNIWFLTLFSLILVLSIYYITMPSEFAIVNSNNKKDTTKVVVKESDILTALRVEAEEQRTVEVDEANKTLNSKDATVDDKNNAFEKIKFINSLKAKEELIEKKIKDNFKLDSFVKVDSNNQVRVVVTAKDESVTLANDIMRSVQEEFENKMFISVKFEK